MAQSYCLDLKKLSLAELHQLSYDIKQRIKELTPPHTWSQLDEAQQSGSHLPEVSGPTMYLGDSGGAKGYGACSSYVCMTTTQVTSRVQVWTATGRDGIAPESSTAEASRAENPPPLPTPSGDSGLSLGERVRAYNDVNDPWEGSGAGPSQWEYPFYGGSQIFPQVQQVQQAAPGLLRSRQEVPPCFGR